MRQANIQKHDLRLQVIRFLQSCGPIVGDLDCVSLHLEKQRKTFRRIHVIVYNQNPATAGLSGQRLILTRCLSVPFGSRCRQGWQTYHKLTALPRAWTRGCDCTRMQFDQTPHQRETDAEPSLGSVYRPFGLREEIENVRQ